jgi:hypothetical protein
MFVILIRSSVQYRGITCCIFRGGLPSQVSYRNNNVYWFFSSTNDIKSYDIVLDRKTTQSLLSKLKHISEQSGRIKRNSFINIQSNFFDLALALCYKLEGRGFDSPIK